MALRFTVLASGSSGNASLLEAGGYGVLLDAGLGPRQLGQRLAAVGSSWAAVDAVLLTHIHTDHWRDTTFTHLLRRRVPLYCHPEHHDCLVNESTCFGDLRAAGLIRDYAAHAVLALAPGLRCRPLPIAHDSGATFGFRFEGEPDLFGHAAALGYVADLGSWDDELAEHLADVDLLALEFNHDPDLEKNSGRAPSLIARVLGEHGHLSNGQAADLLRAVLDRSTASRLRYLVQLHLSRPCNRPALAFAAARAVLSEEVAIHTAAQDEPSATLRLGPGSTARVRARAPARRNPPRRNLHPWLPGLEPESVSKGAGMKELSATSI